MASKVEELRKKLYDDAVSDISELASSWGTSEYLAEHHMKRVAVDLDSLISTAHAEGVVEGAEEAKPKIAESTEKLIDWILAMVPPYEGANPQWGRKVLLDLVATAAEQERERIRKEAVDEHWGSIGEDVRRVCTVPVSVLDPPVLAPTKEEP